MTNEREIELQIDLPYDFRIIRYKSSDVLELEIYSDTMDRKTRMGTGVFTWKFFGYHSTVRSALKEYLMRCPTYRAEGRIDLSEIQKMYDVMHEAIEKVKK